MSVEHPPQQDFALYVMGALERADCQRLEQHVRICEACAATLTGEARLETRIRDLYPRISHRSIASPPLPSLPPPHSAVTDRRQLLFPALVMLAASLAFVAGIGRMTTPPRTPEARTAMSENPPEAPAILSFSEESAPSPAAVCRAPEPSRCAIEDSAAFRTCSAPSPLEFETDTPFTPVSAICDRPQ